MKTCGFCGAVNQDDSNFCESCGGAFVNNTVKGKEGTTSALSIVGFILSFLLPIVGLILAVIDVAQNDGRNKGLSIAAIIISCLIIIVFVVAVFIPIYWMIGMMI